MHVGTVCVHRSTIGDLLVSLHVPDNLLTRMASASFQIKSQTRCLVSHADDAHHGFLTASNNLRGTNEVRSCRVLELISMFCILTE